MDRRVFGKIGENMAADVMRAKGYRILKQNYRCCHGEIDIIADRYDHLSFVEVKTRQNFNFGRPCECINEQKKKNIRKTAHCFLEEAKKKGYYPRDYDFQVIEIVIEQTEYAF